MINFVAVVCVLILTQEDKNSITKPNYNNSLMTLSEQKLISTIRYKTAQ